MDHEAKDLVKIEELDEMDVPSTSSAHVHPSSGKVKDESQEVVHQEFLEYLEDPLAISEPKNSIKKEPELNLEVDGSELSFLEDALLISGSYHHIKEDPELDLAVDATECYVDGRETTEEETTTATPTKVRPQPRAAVGNQMERRMAMLDFTVNFLDILEQEEEDDTMMLLWLQNRRKKRRANSISVARNCDDCYNTLINMHLLHDDTKFRHYFRLNVSQFSHVLQLIENDIKKRSYNRVKKPISPAEKLAMTLRFLGTGESYASLAISFQTSKGYVSRLVEDVLSALVNKLSPIYLPAPSTEQHLEQAKEFSIKWQFPNCVGAIGGKRIRMIVGRTSPGYLAYNRREYLSTVLLAIVSANCKFVMVDVGSYGIEGDSGTLQKSKLGNLLSEPTFYPPPTNLPDSNIVTPYVVIGDGAFDLTEHVMKPHSKHEAQQDCQKRNFNYRLCRARRVSENSFALLANVFRVFQQPIPVKVATCHKLVIATCCLHNLLQDAYLERNGEPYYTLDKKLVQPTQSLVALKPCGGPSQPEGISVRQQFTSYFTNEGFVPRQHRSQVKAISRCNDNT